MMGFPLILLTMVAAAFACRVAGYLAMQYLPSSPRFEAALRATPLSVMAGITALALQSGAWAEALALSAVVALTLVFRNDVVSALIGVALVALFRQAGL